MKTREFDPVRSAALRNHLATLPHEAPAIRPASLRRPQVWVTAVTAIVLVLATVGVLRLTAAHSPEPAEGVRILDPLTRVTDPDDPLYLQQGVWPLLHISGTGPGTYALEVPEGVTSVRPLIACAPASDFRVTVGLAYWTRCDRTGTPGTADIPVSAGTQPIAVQIPEGVRWRLAVIVTPQEGTTYSTLRVTGAPAPSSPAVVRYPAPERDEDVPVGIAAGSGSVRGRLFSPVDELAVVTSCTGSGGLVITMSNGLQFGTDEAPLTCGGRSTTAASNDTARGYRGDGRLTYTVRTIGDVRWTATFSSRTEERLPYPSVDGTVLGRVRGSGTESQGALARDADRVRAVVTCRGTGSLSVRLDRADDSGTLDGSAAVPCGASTQRTEQDLAVPSGSAGLRFDVRPTGDVLWTVTFVGR